MSRIIKFRAWVKRPDACFMAYQGQPDLETLQSFIFHYGDEDLMQFTGIDDNNGDELYEGDMCSVGDWYSSDYKEAGFIGEVMFEDGSFFIYRNASKYPFYQELSSCSVFNRNIVKIGNKFENVELI